MNHEAIRKRMKEYWTTATPEQIIANFEKFGVEFMEGSEAQKILWRYLLYDDKDVLVSEERHFLEAMKEYARLMCDKQIQICVDRYYDGKTSVTNDVYLPDFIDNSPYPTELQDDKTI